MSRLPEPPFGARVGHPDDRQGRSRSRDPPAAFVGPQAPYRNDWAGLSGVGPKPEGNREEVEGFGCHEHGGAVGRIA